MEALQKGHRERKLHTTSASVSLDLAKPASHTRGDQRTQAQDTPSTTDPPTPSILSAWGKFHHGEHQAWGQGWHTALGRRNKDATISQNQRGTQEAIPSGGMPGQMEPSMASSGLSTPPPPPAQPHGSSLNSKAPAELQDLHQGGAITRPSFATQHSAVCPRGQPTSVGLCLPFCEGLGSRHSPQRLLVLA